MPKDMQLLLQIRGESHFMKVEWGMECLDMCFDPNLHGNLHMQRTPLIRWGQTYDEIASQNNYAWAFETWATAFIIKS